jgi:hypothetical protein
MELKLLAFLEKHLFSDFREQFAVFLTILEGAVVDNGATLRQLTPPRSLELL